MGWINRGRQGECKAQVTGDVKAWLALYQPTGAAFFNEGDVVQVDLDDINQHMPDGNVGYMCRKGTSAGYVSTMLLKIR